MPKISKATVAKVDNGACWLSLEKSEARLAELNFSKVREIQTQEGMWRFYSRQSPFPPEFLAERGIKPADSVVAFYLRNGKPAEERFGYLLMSSGKSIPSLEDAVQNATVLTQRFLERKSWYGGLFDKTWPFIIVAGAVVPVVGVEAANYFLGSHMEPDVRVISDIGAFVLGSAGTFGGIFYVQKPIRRLFAANAAAQMSNPDGYVYGKDSINLLAGESRQLRDARAEEGVYLSAGVKIGRQEFHEQLMEFLKAGRLKSLDVAQNSSGCYISTAASVAAGLPDDCLELTVLRWFRDKIVANKPGGEELIRGYYNMAPVILASIQANPANRDILSSIFERDVKKVVSMVVAGDYDGALRHCIEAGRKLEQDFGKLNG